MKQTRNLKDLSKTL